MKNNHMEREVAVAKLEGSNVKLYDANGSYMRTIPAGGAVAMDVSGGAVSVKYKNGQVKVYDSKGNYKRTL